MKIFKTRKAYGLIEICAAVATICIVSAATWIAVSEFGTASENAGKVINTQRVSENKLIQDQLNLIQNLQK
jgi:hypothetical protein